MRILFYLCYHSFTTNIVLNYGHFSEKIVNLGFLWYFTMVKPWSAQYILFPQIHFPSKLERNYKKETKNIYKKHKQDI